MMKFDEINTTDIGEIKRALRKTVKEKQALLTREYIEYANEQICRNILGMQEYENAQAVFCFVGRKNEIDTTNILKQVLSDGKKLLVPKCRPKVENIEKAGASSINNSTGIMDAFEITSLDQLEAGAYGILEPKESCTLVEPREIDFAVIPCMSCDAEGNRLGHGGGYYDRYLQLAEKQAKSLGMQFCTRVVICRERMMMVKVPTEDTDQKMDYVVNENKIVRL